MGIGFQIGPEVETSADLQTKEFLDSILFLSTAIPKGFYYAKQGRPMFMQIHMKFLAAEFMRLEMQASDEITTVPDQARGELLV